MRLPNQIERGRAAVLPGLPVARDEIRDFAAPLAIRGVMALLAAVAAGLSAYLAWLSFTGASVAGCDAGGAFDCDHVLATRWSTWLGVPIALPAVGIYASILAAVAFLGPRVPSGVRQAAWWIVLGLSATAALAGLWFIGLQMFAVGSYCWPCLATHACALLLAATAWTTACVASRRGDAVAPGSKWVAATASFLVAAVLIGGQFAYEPPTFRIDRDDVAAAGSNSPAAKSADEQATATAAVGEDSTPDKASHTAQKPPLKRIVRLRNTPMTFDAYEHPILGSPDAEHVIVKLFDYTCHHCRDQHFQLEEAREILGNRLAVLVLPVPMNGRCNAFAPPASSGPHEFACMYARLAVAVWRLDRTKFAEFHHWLFEPESPPSVEAARNKVRDLVGEAGIDLVDNSVEPIHQVEKYTNLYGSLGRGKIPKLVDEHMIIDGRFRDGKQIVEMLEEQWKLAK